jgi:glyoxylase I family protein
MAQVVGIGGVFFRARDPEGLRQWYAEHLGIDVNDDGSALFEGGQTVWSLFREDTDYFGPSGQQGMVNYRVDDLDAVRERLRSAGASVDERTEEYDFGRFGWASDPEGNRFELWQPTEG